MFNFAAQTETATATGTSSEADMSRVDAPSRNDAFQRSSFCKLLSSQYIYRVGSISSGDVIPMMPKLCINHPKCNSLNLCPFVRLSVCVCVCVSLFLSLYLCLSLPLSLFLLSLSLPLFLSLIGTKCYVELSRFSNIS